ncbi:unnamed protein product [Anisakis simplex]|uniref:Ovule protein n=1 Tax=Anisakis simplex TaxID=6269 RepID=A0A0M3K2R0_ANISI|nr:unnamed protein product [Anisakis simplex]
MAQKLADIIMRHTEGNELKMEEDEEICNESEDKGESSENIDDGVLVVPDKVAFSNGKLISASDVHRAIDFCRSTSDEHRPLSSMLTMSRFISNKNDMKRPHF